MYFYLSKTLEFFAVPSNAVALVMVCGLLLWRTRYGRIGRRLTVTGVVLLLIAGVAPVGTALTLPLENRFPQWQPGEGPPDGVIVLGGIVNGYISRKRNDISFGRPVARLLAAVDLAHQYPAARIVFTSGNPSMMFSALSETGFAVRFLEHYGVASDRILVDRGARNTMENAVDAKKLAAPKPGERWLLVTSAAHMPRAIGLFRAAGFPVEAYPVDFSTGGWRDLAGLPGFLLGGIFPLDIAAHEWEGLLVDWIIGRSAALLPGPADTHAPN